MTGGENDKMVDQDDEVSVVSGAEEGMKSPEVALEGESADPEQDIELLLEDARARADEHWDQVLRLQAELENLRRRTARDLEQAHKFALEKFVNELLAVKDSLEMGLSASTETANVESLREGMDMTLNMLTGVFGKFNVTEVSPDGEPFDPEQHQAMSMVESAEVAPNTVINVVQKGYLLNGRLVRPAMVVVSKAPAG